MNEPTRSRIASAPRRSVSAVELTMSQNNTVTCLISPGRPAAPEATQGAAASCRPGASSSAPQCPQNLCSAGLAIPQDGQASGNDAPHRPQNFMPAELSTPQ
ncbi:MAG TPA: hypothetical protein VNV18_11960 [Stellaceae bacterium]|nr:hypothetical protein [Stellaceae bacterium]